MLITDNSLPFSVQQRSPEPVPAPAKGVNKVFLEESIEQLLRKRSYAVHLDPCYLHLKNIQESCDESNSTLSKRDCFRNCGKLINQPIFFFFAYLIS